jgi:tetratricopeptide (TPR) repeat protein
MRCCIGVLYMLAFGASVALAAAGGVTDISLLDAQGAPEVPAGDPDALYQQRESLAQATRAVAIWAARLQEDPGDFEAAWKLSRGHYWLGTHGLPRPERKAALEQGVAAARAAVAADPRRPDGHFWLAANMGALAESFGLRQGMRYRSAIRESLETVLALDRTYLQGSADRALGRWYFKVPGMFGGDLAKSETHLRTALGFNEHSVITRLFLAETLEARGQRDAAIDQLKAAIAAPPDPQWGPEDTHFREQAQARLTKLVKRTSGR